MRILSRIFMTSAVLLFCCGATAKELSLTTWTQQPLVLPQAKEKIGIVDLVKVLTEFREIGYCNVFFTEFIDRKENKYNTIVLDKNNGYGSCQIPGSAYHLEISYWKRNNGHLLAGLNVFWEDEGLEGQGEGDEMFSETYFFDYNPKTHRLTPDSSLSKIINDYRKKDYHILLPRQGKNLQLRQFEGAGGAMHYLKWNGYDFDQKIYKGKLK